MTAVSTVELTVQEWRKIHDELCALQERRWAATQSPIAAQPMTDTDGDGHQNLSSVESRIANLENMLARAAPVDAEQETGTIRLGSHVTVLWEDDGQETYDIVEPPDAAARNGHISYESPIGQALPDRPACR
ncbi:MAG: transcription elongation factor GreA [Thermomicrobiales bacterium]|jgi:transcription elongation GreA/GreB family factor|nr:transcription elongation factor GreA [Thermomicrobiales bacterium]